MSAEPTATLARRLTGGDRRSLSRAITLVESRRAEDRARALELLKGLAARVGSACRVGLAGAPGVGKSTLLEALGMHLVESGRRPAVLCVDPSSERSGGSVLGDKTRMVRLSQSPRAYVRPSPASGAAGGVAPGTGDALTLCEAAGYDPVIVETVGVGQGESGIVSVVDVLVLVVEPGSGDELQGIKRGLNEWGDVVVVNKADGERRKLAERSRAQLESALGVLRAGELRLPVVLLVSALEQRGVRELWAAVDGCFRALESSGELERRRRRRRLDELERRLLEALRADFEASPERARRLSDVRARVESGEMLATEAIRELFRSRAPDR